MTFKFRMELVFLGAVIMAIAMAVLALLIAIAQTPDDNQFSQNIKLVSGTQLHDANNQRGNNANKASAFIFPKTKIDLEFDQAHLLLKNLESEQDLTRAHDLLISATQKDSSKRAEAAFELGTIYRMFPTDECQKLAFIWFKKSAEWGFRKGHLELAKSYHRGLGVQIDYAQARQHYRIAALEGSAAGALKLIELTRQGLKDTKGDLSGAKLLFQEFMPMLENAANKGDARAARSIGRLYLSGNIIQKNPRRAEEWLTKAANFGDAVAMHDLAFLKLGQKIEGNSNTIIALLTKSADLGYSAAMTALGRFHLDKQFGLTSSDAIVWFEKGVAAGHAGSMEELAQIFFEGRLVDKNVEKARSLALRGVKQKHAGSAKILARIETSTEQK